LILSLSKGASATAVPTSKPVVQIECSSRLAQIIAVADEGTPNSNVHRMMPPG